MIGDREDNDIIPSKEIGFKTIKFNGNERYNSDFNVSIANYKINSLNEILELNLNCK